MWWVVTSTPLPASAAAQMVSHSPDGVPQPSAGQRVHARGRLVEYQQVGPVREGLDERQPALHAQREPAHRDGCRRTQLGRHHGLAFDVHRTRKGEIFGRSEVIVETETLRHVAQAAARFPGRRLTEEQHRAGGGSEQAK
jgi:hypothetical protein